MTPPATTLMSARPMSFSASIISGMSVRWPAASELAPTTSTSASTAICAVSRGVWNSGPGITSKPRSVKAEETRFAPRSCPSWPILATRPNAFDSRNLPSTDPRIVDLEDVVLLLLGGAVAVDADNHRLAGVDLRRARRGGFLDAVLGEALGDRFGHPAMCLDLRHK